MILSLKRKATLLQYNRSLEEITKKFKYITMLQAWMFLPSADATWVLNLFRLRPCIVMPGCPRATALGEAICKTICDYHQQGGSVSSVTAADRCDVAIYSGCAFCVVQCDYERWAAMCRDTVPFYSKIGGNHAFLTRRSAEIMQTVKDRLFWKKKSLQLSYK
jgi:hypothetical protein